jgi:HAD superfamily hydrolase (TIGR01509 family)
MEDYLAAEGSQNRASIEAVIFDLDGTLVQSNDFHVEAWRLAFLEFGKKFPMAQLRSQIGKGSDQYLPEFLTPEEIEQFGHQLDKFRSTIFRNAFLPRVRPFPNVRELFERIKADGKRIALATSSHAADVKTYTEVARITDLVDCQTSADDTDRSKPSPDVFEAALAQLNKPASAAVAIGDTRFDMEAAKRIGLTAIGFLCGGAADEHTLRNAGAVAVYKDPADLLVNYDSSPLAIPTKKTTVRVG